jgi:hypothetical protein
MVVTGVNAAVGRWILSEQQNSSPIYIAISLTIFAWMAWVLFVKTRRNSLLIFERRAQRKTFLERNRDDFAKMLIAAIVGGLLTFAGTQLKERFFLSTTTSVPK